MPRVRAVRDARGSRARTFCVGWLHDHWRLCREVSGKDQGVLGRLESKAP